MESESSGEFYLLFSSLDGHSLQNDPLNGLHLVLTPGQFVMQQGYSVTKRPQQNGWSSTLQLRLQTLLQFHLGSLFLFSHHLLLR